MVENAVLQWFYHKISLKYGKYDISENQYSIFFNFLSVWGLTLRSIAVCFFICHSLGELKRCVWEREGERSVQCLSVFYANYWTWKGSNTTAWEHFSRMWFLS